MNPCQLDVLYHRVASDIFKLVGQIVGTDVKCLCQSGQRNIFRVVGMDIVGNSINLFFHTVFHVRNVMV